MLDKLNAKKAALVAQRDQVVANLNAIVGAIALCDDLIAEAVAERVAAKAAESERINVTSIGDVEPRFVPDGPYLSPGPHSVEKVFVGPEMPPVTKFEPCDRCDDDSDRCEEFGCMYPPATPD